MKRHGLLFVCLILFLLTSCKTNQVVSNSIIQKRKYKKGWHINIVPKYSVKDVVSINKDFVESKSQKDSNINKNQIHSRVSDSILIHTEKRLAIHSVDNIKFRKNTTVKKYIFKVPSIIPRASYESNSKVIRGMNHSSKNHFIDPWLSEEAVQIILAILAILVLIFTGITPLAVWISVGPGPALKLNTTIFIAFLLCSLVFAMSIFSLFVYSAASVTAAGFALVIVLGVLMVVLGIVSFFHALVSIIKGF